MTGTTKSGFNYEVCEEDIQDNFELLQMIRKSETDGMVICDIAEMVLGNDQLNALLNHCRNERGVAKFTVVSAEITEIIQNINSAKN